MDLQLSNQMKRVYELLDIDPQEDRQASVTACRFFKNHQESIKNIIDFLWKKIKDRNAIVFGAGPSLDDALKESKDVLKDLDNFLVFIAADGATEALLNNDILPHVIVTDFDGNTSLQLEALNHGAILVLHWHGDNYKRLESMLSQQSSIKGILPTVQVGEVEYVPNFGGFTDGDRAVHLAYHFGARKIVLMGFDFGHLVGKYSKPEFQTTTTASPFKRAKLKIAREFIETLASKGEIYQYIPNNIDEDEEISSIRGVPQITLPLLQSVILE